MNKKLYDLMDWAAIEELVYGECDRPDEILGSHNRGRSSLVQAFFPGAESVTLYINGSGVRGKSVKDEVNMEKADDAGFFAALLPGNDRKDYRYHVEYATEDGESKKKKKYVKTVDCDEIYGKGRLLSEAEETRFVSGAETKAYTYMGAHKKSAGNLRGVVFRLWAPDAVRVSVVGNFNSWDAMINPMNRLQDSGIFELFIPGIEEGEEYAYDVLMKGGVSVRKADPYSLMQKDSYDAVSIVSAFTHKWKDDKWMEGRKKFVPASSYVNIYTLPLQNMPEGFLKDKKAVTEMADYIAGMGYSHVELLPLMVYPGDDDAGFHPALLCAPDTRSGNAEELMTFIDAMHAKNVGVILQWAPGDFSNVSYGLGSFDGSSIYEYADPRKGVEPRTGMLKFDMGRPQVRTYLLSALNCWIENYHIDGFNTQDLACMLYLDYYRNPGEWIPNMYGGVENLEAISFFKEMNAMLHKAKSGLMSIASGAACFPKVTEVSDEGLGFDLVADADCIRELIDYLSRDPIVRRSYHQALTGSMLYQYCEHYLLPIGLSNVNFRQGGIRMRMYGDSAQQWKGLKLLYAYQALHTGKNSSFCGQEYGENASFEDMDRELPDAKKELEAEVMRAYIRSLNQLCRTESALYAEDADDDFVWLKEQAAEDNVLCFIRQDKKKSFICVFNFANVDRNKYFIGVDREGKYKEIFSSENGGLCEGSTVAARKGKTDGWQYNIRLQLPALSVKIYQYIPFSAEEKAEIKRREEERERKRREEEAKRQKLKEERMRLRHSLKDELAKKIAAAEAAIASGSESKGKKKK